MNNLYHKVAVASVCTALSFTLGANKEAKAATITLQPSERFIVFDETGPNGEPDGRGDSYYGGVPYLPVWRRPSGSEIRAFYEFNISNLSLAPNTVISYAAVQAKIQNF